MWIITPARARKSIQIFMGFNKGNGKKDNGVSHTNNLIYDCCSVITSTFQSGMFSGGFSEGGGRTLFGRKISSLLKSMDMKTCEPEIAVGLLR